MKLNWVVVILSVALIIAVGLYIKYPQKPQNFSILAKWRKDAQNSFVIALECESLEDYEASLTATYPNYDIIQEEKEGTKCYYLLEKK